MGKDVFFCHRDEVIKDLITFLRVVFWQLGNYLEGESGYISVSCQETPKKKGQKQYVRSSPLSEFRSWRQWVLIHLFFV